MTLAEAKRHSVPELKLVADEMVMALEAEEVASRTEKGASRDELVDFCRRKGLPITKFALAVGHAGKQTRTGINALIHNNSGKNRIRLVIMARLHSSCVLSKRT